MRNEEKRWLLWAVVAVVAFLVFRTWDGPVGFILVCLVALGGYILEARLNIDKSNDD